jgi:hypothetical protein
MIHYQGTFLVTSWQAAILTDMYNLDLIVPDETEAGHLKMSLVFMESL